MEGAVARPAEVEAVLVQEAAIHPNLKRASAPVLGGGAILLGLPYILHAFGPTEAEFVTWGRVSVWAGIVLGLLWLGIGRSNRTAAKAALAGGILLVALLQVPPILLWFAFHGTGISDGSPPSTFVAHWGYAIPHVVLLVACVAGFYRLVQGGPKPADQTGAG